ncbi:outer membrane beta-barrel protein, partial [Enterococcus faecalis]|uniref:outer membrane beta-barrel protein n=1 Tax=Enterococcus faecalis TaxID=1351 RepID=UPI00403EF743
NRRNQFDIVEAYVNAHLPILTSGGVDIKAGQFVTLEGAEVIDATGDFFYSHTYIFNFGIPFKHTGILTTTHVNKTLDIYAG